MESPTLLAASLADVAAGGFFVVVGILVARRPVAPEMHMASRMFTAWWFGLAGLTAVSGFAISGGLLGALAAVAGPSAVTPSAATFFVVAWLFLSCIALWGLLGYLSFLFRGRSHAAAIGGAYAALFIAFSRVALWESPQGIEASQFGVRIVNLNPVPTPVLILLLLLLILPQIGGAAAYASLYRRVQDPAARYRVGLVSTSLLVWLTLSLLASALGVETTPAGLVALRVLALLSATAILLAYSPPGFIRRRLARRSTGP